MLGSCGVHVGAMFSLCSAKNIDAPKRTRRFWVKGLHWVDVGAYTGYFCLYSPNSLLLRVLTTFLKCPPWCWMVCPPFRGLVSPCLPTCVPLLDCVSAFSRHVRLPEPLSPLSPSLFPSLSCRLSLSCPLFWVSQFVSQILSLPVSQPLFPCVDVVSAF